MTTTVVIPTIRANQQMLDNCIDSVKESLREGDSLLVVEGGTFAQNCNSGASLVEDPFIILLNDDCVVDGDWIDRLLEPFSDLQVGIVGARLLYPDGRIQHSGIYFTMDDGILMGWNRTWDVDAGPVDAVTGACLAIRASLFRDLGGFDTGFLNGNEDVDLCLRARQSGHTIWYTPDATITHLESQSGAPRWAHTAHNVARLQELWTVSDPADQ